MDNKKEKVTTNKYNFQGHSERSMFWFDFDHEWVEENFSTRELGFYLKNYIKNILGTKRGKHINYL